MSLLSDIQKDAIDSKSDIAELLRRCMVLAYQLDNNDFKNWVDHELNGYPEGSSIPEYRVLFVESYGNFLGVGWAQANNTPIPLSTVDDEHREYLSKHVFVDSISALSSLVEGNKGNESLAVSWPHDFIAYYSGKILSGWRCTNAWKHITTNSIVSILTTVRSRILAFILELEKDIPDIGEDTSKQVDKEQVQHNVQTIIMGNVANLVAEGSQSITYNTSIEINKNDFESLKQYLLSNDLSEDDIEELRNAIQEDGNSNQEKIQGDKVTSWYWQMIDKANKGIWQVGVSVATQLLTQALLRYYGLQ